MEQLLQILKRTETVTQHALHEDDSLQTPTSLPCFDEPYSSASFFKTDTGIKFNSGVQRSKNRYLD